MAKGNIHVLYSLELFTIYPPLLKEIVWTSQLLCYRVIQRDKLWRKIAGQEVVKTFFSVNAF